MEHLEITLLSWVMNNNPSRDQVKALVDWRDFTLSSHQEIARAISHVAEKGEPVNGVTVWNWLEENDKAPDRVGPERFRVVAERGIVDFDPVPIAAYLRRVRVQVNGLEQLWDVLVERSRTETGFTDREGLDAVYVQIDRIVQTVAKTGLAVGGGPEAIRFVAAQDLKVAPVTWLIEQILPAGMLTLFSGKDKIGKTLMAWEMVRAITGGAPFLGRYKTEVGTVLFAAMDDPPGVTAERIEKAGLREGGRVRVATSLMVDLTRMESFFRALAFAARESGAKLIVIDALYLLIIGGQENLNDATAMTPIVRALSDLAEREQCAVLLIHHDRKTGDEFAGSYAIRAAAKHVLRIAPSLGVADPSAPGVGQPRVLHVWGKMTAPLVLDLLLDGEARWVLVRERANVEVEGLEKAIDRVLRENPEGLNARAIEAKLGKRRQDVRRVLEKLRVSGRVTVRDLSEPGASGRPRKTYFGANGLEDAKS